MVVTPEFESTRRFENGRAEVKLTGQWVLIDKKGKVVNYKKLRFKLPEIIQLTLDCGFHLQLNDFIKKKVKDYD